VTQSVETTPPQDAAPQSGHPTGRRLPLIGAIGLTVVAALILVYELATIVSERTQAPVLATSVAAAAPVPLSSQPFSFLDQPAAVPALKFVDGSERPVSLADFKGRPVLLNIWATWCLPCRKEMPSLDRLQAKFDPARFLVLTLSIDRAGIPAVKKFYADLGLKSLGIYVDQSGAALRQLGLIGIPGTLLINPDGEEIGRKLGPAEWDSPQVIALLREHFGLEAAKAAGGAAL
jgi:thiol-disulfide isomerase/thioredoxin